MNKVVKEEDRDNSNLRRKKKTVCDIVERLRGLVQQQESEQFLAVLGKGEYKIVDEYQHLAVGDNYYRMTAKQKAALKEEFFTCCRTERTQSSHHVSEQEKPQEVETQTKQSVVPENSQIITFLYTILKEMFSEAGSLLKCHNGLINSPSLAQESSGPKKVDLWYVASKEDSRRPHSVQVADTGRVTCDDRCIRWARHNICSHTVAVAENLGMLPKYLQWFRSRRKTCTVTKMAEIGTPKCSRQKNKATQKRKGRANIPAPLVETRFPTLTRIPDNGETSQMTAATTQTTELNSTTAVRPAPLDIARCTTTCTLSSSVQLGQGGFPSTVAHVPTLKPDPPPGLAEVTLLHLCDPRVTICHRCGQPI